MEITLTPAEEKDLERLLTLARLAARNPDSHWDENYPDLEILQWDIDQKALYCVEGDGMLIGMISLAKGDEDIDCVWPAKDENACMMSRLGLHPDYQGKGLMQQVFEAAIAQCGALGYRTLRLLVAADLSRLIRVYERCGFVRAGRAHLWGEDYFQYQRVL